MGSGEQVVGQRRWQRQRRVGRQRSGDPAENWPRGRRRQYNGRPAGGEAGSARGPSRPRARRGGAERDRGQVPKHALPSTPVASGQRPGRGWRSRRPRPPPPTCAGGTQARTGRAPRAAELGRRLLGCGAMCRVKTNGKAAQFQPRRFRLTSLVHKVARLASKVPLRVFRRLRAARALGLLAGGLGAGVASRSALCSADEVVPVAVALPPPPGRARSCRCHGSASLGLRCRPAAACCRVAGGQPSAGPQALSGRR